MGYKELFVDYSTMSAEEIKEHSETRLAYLKKTNYRKYEQEISKIKQNEKRFIEAKKVIYKKSFTKEQK